MKKAVILFTTLLLLFAFPLSALADATSFEYKDEKTGTVLIIPAGWAEVKGADIGIDGDCVYVHRDTEKDVEEADDSDEEEDEKTFVPYIAYASVDIAGEYNDKRREEVNLDSFSTGELAKILGISEKELAKATYNETDYYRFETDAARFTQSLEKGQRVTGYVTVKNGWLYKALFFDDTDSDVYDDFKTLMGSIQLEGKTPEVTQKDSRLITPKKALSLAVMLAAIIAFGIVLIKTKKKYKKPSRL